MNAPWYRHYVRGILEDHTPPRQNLIAWYVTICAVAAGVVALIWMLN